MRNDRVFIETFGCQMNELDTELVVGALRKEGYQFVERPEDANVVLYNTCSVRALSEQKVLSRLGIARQRKAEGEKLVVGVLGCMAERANTDILKNNSAVDLLLGPSKLNEVPQLLEKALEQGGPKKRHIALSNFRDRKAKPNEESAMDDLEALDASRPLSEGQQKGQAFIRITRGCNKFCSFCVVPRTRGPEVHRSPDAIVEEAKRLADSGVLEITLLGQTINHYFYRDDKGKLTSFADLLYRVHEEVPHLARLRFLTSYPRDFTDEALDVMAASDRICKYLHVPAQSGSNRILQRMNRGYTREEYMGLIERAKKRMPNIAIIGDMIVGFPTETEDDFEQSLSLLREVRYKNVFVFKYSIRPGTVAKRRETDEIPDAVKKDRHARMLSVQNAIGLEHHQAMIGQTYDVMVESKAKLDPTVTHTDTIQIGFKGRTTNARLAARTYGDHIVTFDAPESLIGQIARVRIDQASSLCLSGSWVSPTAP